MGYLSYDRNTREWGGINEITKVMVKGEVPVYVNGELVYSPHQTFRVGDFVRINEVAFGDVHVGIAVGMVGKVVVPPDDIGVLGVELVEFTRGHSCDGRTASGHGKWIPARYLELIDRPIDTTFPS